MRFVSYYAQTRGDGPSYVNMPPTSALQPYDPTTLRPYDLPDDDCIRVILIISFAAAHRTIDFALLVVIGLQGATWFNTKRKLEDPVSS
ncbi:hypothetical protein CSOJ01_06707 [Colletotrichum sojae]|uniref:Uncharacterized protein n=1 Tax=Colletotrichum sojae TaxID=2175907 RepID=A0A8H6JB14_9PEZI|nr:hypothetical protein CSOJ01_06707 [Colletotrichum sojae]